MHTIRLREPWQASWEAAAAPTGQGNVDASRASTSRLCYRRKFNCPTGLDAGQSVSLELRCRTPIVGVAARLNSRELMIEPQPPETWLACVDAMLQPFNELEIHISVSRTEYPGLSACPKIDEVAEVQLVIRG